MKNRLFTAARSFIYGALSFAACGFLMQWPFIGYEKISYEFIFSLSLVGGASFVVSYVSGAILIHFIKDLAYGHS